MPLAIASVPSSDPHAAYLEYLRRTGRGNTAYLSAARTFFQRWPDPQEWAAGPLHARLSAGAATRPIITFLMLHQGLQPGYDYLLERKLSSIWREVKDSPLAVDLDRFMTAAADLGFTDRVRFATGSQVPVRLLIQTGRTWNSSPWRIWPSSPPLARTDRSAPARDTTTTCRRQATPSGCCSTSESSMSCPAASARPLSPSGWPRFSRRSGQR
ncbi:hypothetical protein [Arthrobacter sp. Bz4]|uniref:hypothetical protein n=1 Tax=Arthrobacter sp. Bz4 TaxID=2171979 RepID=UPI001FAF458F|nr:hypothetical protein [Arthrobacter sp. Bz4]